MYEHEQKDLYPPPTSSDNSTIISIVIPMFNSSKYISECLDSLLAQSFQDFEVIVVDDCSTDNSVAIVESYAPKFNGRLRLAHTEVNSGGGGYVPRNIGLTLAKGEYVYFMDADDFILLTALETLYDAAKQHDADVVYCGAYYELRGVNDVYLQTDDKYKKLLKEGLEDEPALTVNDPEKNLQSILFEGDFRSPWTKFVRRSFLIEKEIVYPEIPTGGDYLWSINVYSSAGKILRQSSAVYFYRSYNAGYVARRKRKVQSKVSYWVSAFVAWMKSLRELANRNQFLQKHAQWCYQVLIEYFKYCLSNISDEVVNRFYSKDTYEILCNEFSKGNVSADVTVPFFFSIIANREKSVLKSQKVITTLKEEVKQQKKELSSNEKTVAKSQQRIAELETKVNQQKKKLSSNEKTAAESQQRIAELETKVNQQKKKLSSNEKTAAESQQRIIELETKVNQQKKKLSSNEKTAAKSQQRIIELETKVDQQKKELSSNEKTVAKSQQRIIELENALAQQMKNRAPGVDISVIIPMYNAEKFIGEALESILEQTFDNYEVIVVDDCSKDSSYKVVESYIPKFDGRLKLLSMGKNSGSAPAPRNKGFLISRGEYIFFMDSDDTFTKTALEEMYNLAKEYDADVVYCEKYYMSTGVGQDYIDNIHLADSSIQHGGFVDKPTVISDDISERLQELSERKFWVTPWQRLVSRKLLVENNIIFPEIIGSDDVVWCFQVLCVAKRFLRVPNICYIRRMYDESFTKAKKAPSKHMHQWMDVTIRGLKFVDNFMDRVKFFQDNPSYRYFGLEILSRSSFNVVYPVYSTLQVEEIYDIFLKEFAKDTGEHDVLVAFLCTKVCEKERAFREERKKVRDANREDKQDKKRIAELEAEIKRLQSENDRLQIRRHDLVESSTVKIACPAISVVIPMYNAEEYIGECLDSLLAQTFTDFEVIVADDCSTDNSVGVVKEYAPKFNGLLKITHTKKNSGGGGYIPRNLGLRLAGGKYVIFLDSDDFLLTTALETLYKAAEEYEADVVYSSTYYNVIAPNDVELYRDGFARKLVKEGIEDKLSFTVNDTDKIFMEFLASSEGNFRAPWSKFVRRDFLLENEILFPDIVTGGDCIWCINVYAYAKRFLRLPTPLYFYRRYNTTSITRTMRTPAEQVSYWAEAFVAFLKALNNLQSRTEVLRENPFYCYEATRGGHFEWCLNRTHDARNELSNKEVYEILYRELSKDKDLFEAAVPFFFSVIDNEKKNREEKLQTIKDLRKEITRLKKKA